MTIEYRPFEPADAEACRALILACVDDLVGMAPDACEKLRCKVRSAPYREQLGDMYCIVATECGAIVGMGALDGGAIKRMYVGSPYRGRRIGKAIHDRLEGEARRRGLARLELEASLNAVGFYERMGYAAMGERTWHLDGAAVTHLNMAKDLRTQQRAPLYSGCEAECLQVRETMTGDDIKYRLLLDNLGPCRRLVDIGCGWGQFLALAHDRVDEVWAVDECPDRIKDVHKVCPKAKMVICRADQLDLPDAYFDAVVTSQMLHEVKLFGQAGELERALAEIHRVLARGGRYLLLDHQDAGDGEVVVHLPDEQLAKLAVFEGKYRFYRASHDVLGDGGIRLSRRCLQDLLSKDWSLDSAMETIEMNETHNVFERQATTALLASAGLHVREWIDFAAITTDLEQHGGRLGHGDAWSRKFLAVAEKR